MKTILLHKDDDVVIAGERVPAGTTPMAGARPLENAISSGHKVSRRPIPSGAPIRKFGQIIGFATSDIPKGAHVHVQNCAFAAHENPQGLMDDLASARAAVPAPRGLHFMGYRRADGQVGTRNMIALLATVNCSATVVRKAAAVIEASGILDAYPNVDGVVALAHGTGCGMAPEGPGWDNLQRVLWGHASHPNIGAAVFVGLGCEVMQIARMKSAFDAKGHERFHGLTIQEKGGTRRTVEEIVGKVRDLLPGINAVTRTKEPVSSLTVALQCGGSDGMSGITANPALGAASDLVVGEGGRVILAETPEIYGAEHLLLNRAANETVASDLNACLNWWEHYTRINNATMDNNPSPGNKAGGLTTILEKSLGAVAKAGSTPLNQVVAYGEKPSASGLIFMDSPGYDPVSVTGQIASGAQIVVFTTGRGSAFGSKPAPTIKLATNDALFERMPDDMDLNCGDMMSRSVSVAEKGREVFDMILEVASGRTSKSERLGLGDHEFLPWQIGAVM